MKAYINIKKHKSVLLTQLHIDKVGFNAFLYLIRVLDIQGLEYDYQEGDIIVEHVLLKCP
jgi:hypothetical protein